MHGDLVQRLLDRAYSSKAPDPLVEEAAAEIARLRLTDAERRDISIAADAYDDNDDDADCERIAATLRGLLERIAR